VYSILELTKVQPVHYALGTSPERLESAYPGFVVEAARSAKLDWEQEEKPVEETTKIRAEAIPTGLQLTLPIAGLGGSEGEPSGTIEQDKSMPMQGEDILPLTPKAMERVINWGVDESSAIKPCSMMVDQSVKVFMDPKELVETHIGVFGFTGTGKSNLVSTLITELLSVPWTSGIKVIVIDYMFEYFPLLVDSFCKLDDAYIILDFYGLPAEGDVLLALRSGDERSILRASRALLKAMVKPKRLREPKVQSFLTEVLKSLFEKERVRILVPAYTSQDIAEELRKVVEEFNPDHIGLAYKPIRSWIERISQLQFEGAKLPEALTRLSDELRGYAGRESFPEVTSPSLEPSLEAFIPDELAPASRRQGVRMSPTAVSCVREMAKRLQDMAREITGHRDINARITVDGMVDWINQTSEKPSLFILYSEKPDRLREVYSDISKAVYEWRVSLLYRKRGESEPPVLFVLDEADEFIPYGESGSTYVDAREAAETIARRGRKLGLGLCVATQRAAYLETRTVGQLHTYFVSKLPREHDRKTVAEAYGVERSVIDQALRFATGQWVVISHSATGLKGVPIATVFPNAEDRVLDFWKTWTSQPHFQ
jgi:DNA helicase HerA-like ATPase